MITERTNTMSPRGGTREGAGRPTGSGSGTVNRDASGRPVRIAWNNGVIMTR